MGKLNKVCGATITQQLGVITVLLNEKVYFNDFVKRAAVLFQTKTIQKM